MTIRFFAYYRDPEYTGRKEMTMAAPHTVRDLGDALCSQFGSPFAEEFFNSGRTAPGDRIIIMINGRRVEFLDGLDTLLRESDVVQLFPVVAGG
ncbi:MAG: MoaD/ThiS family protein [Lachnospiraceae bacterium]|nr:MoaD/ThiS family protein [Lachnospiraceae bacterium]